MNIRSIENNMLDKKKEKSKKSEIFGDKTMEVNLYTSIIMIIKIAPSVNCHSQLKHLHTPSLNQPIRI